MNYSTGEFQNAGMFPKVNVGATDRLRNNKLNRYSEERERSHAIILFAYSILANVLFWSGLITPYNSSAGSSAFYTLVVIVLLGLTFATFGLAATFSIVNRNKPNGSQRLVYVAGILNVIVLVSAAGFWFALLSGKGI